MMFKAILCLAFVANAVVAVPSHSRRHHDLAVRMASPNNIEPVALVQKRSNSSRCKPRPTTSSTTTSAAVTTTSATASSTKVVGNVASAPTSTQVHTSSQEPSSSSSPTSTKASSTHTSSTQQSQPAQSQSSGGGGGSVSGPFSGDGTYYDTGLVACGGTFTDSDLIVAVSHEYFDTYPGYNDVNPNNNPICGKTITAKYNGNTVTVTAQDRCVGCAKYDLDFTPAAIAKLEPNYLQIGRIHNVEWTIEN